MKSPWFWLGWALIPSCVMATPLDLRFIASSPEFDGAAGEYREIWHRDGSRISEVLDRVSGRPLHARQIEVRVFEGVSRSGRSGAPMWLRASYPTRVKRATLTHELLHRYVDESDGLKACYPEVHDILGLMLLDAWSELWGLDFAYEQAAVEAARSPRYQKSWKRVLAKSDEERRLELARRDACNPGSKLD